MCVCGFAVVCVVAACSVRDVAAANCVVHDVVSTCEVDARSMVVTIDTVIDGVDCDCVVFHWLCWCYRCDLRWCYCL